MNNKMIFFLTTAFLVSFINAANSNQFELKKIMTIGGDESLNEYFLGVAVQIKIDSNGFIYVLDGKDSSIKKFSKDGKHIQSIGKLGEGPGELSDFFLASIALLDDDSLIALDRIVNKVLLFDHNGNFNKSFKVKEARGLIVDKNNHIIIISGIDEKIFHAYDLNGNHLYAFGELFEVPDEYPKLKNLVGWRVPPWGCYSKKNDSILAVHNYKYEVISFNKNSTKMLFSNKNQSIKPIKYLKRDNKEISRNAYSVHEYKGKCFVSYSKLNKNDIEVNYVLDIFDQNGLLNTINVNFYLYEIDKDGNLYFIENGGETIVKYSLIKK
jgi:hypothetical protein